MGTVFACNAEPGYHFGERRLPTNASYEQLGRNGGWSRPGHSSRLSSRFARASVSTDQSIWARVARVAVPCLRYLRAHRRGLWMGAGSSSRALCLRGGLPCFCGCTCTSLCTLSVLGYHNNPYVRIIICSCPQCQSHGRRRLHRHRARIILARIILLTKEMLTHLGIIWSH